MSISSEIDRISNAKLDLASAIAEKGVSVSVSESINAYADKIRSIRIYSADENSDAVVDDGYGNITINPLYSFNYFDYGNGNIILTVIPASSAEDVDGNIILK